METPKLGQLITEPAGRDAIHLAIAPVVAGQRLRPGERVGLHNGKAYDALNADSVGIVDPFLTQHVEAGQSFYLCLYPGSVTSLRHVWTSPAFPPARLKETP